MTWTGSSEEAAASKEEAPEVCGFYPDPEDHDPDASSSQAQPRKPKERAMEPSSEELDEFREFQRWKMMKERHKQAAEDAERLQQLGEGQPSAISSHRDHDSQNRLTNPTNPRGHQSAHNADSRKSVQHSRDRDSKNSNDSRTKDSSGPVQKVQKTNTRPSIFSKAGTGFLRGLTAGLTARVSQTSASENDDSKYARGGAKKSIVHGNRKAFDAFSGVVSSDDERHSDNEGRMLMESAGNQPPVTSVGKWMPEPRNHHKDELTGEVSPAHSREMLGVSNDRDEKHHGGKRNNKAPKAKGGGVFSTLFG